MRKALEWLPSIATLADYQGAWKDYLEAIYEHFHRDFVRSKPHYTGKRFALKRHPMVDQKEATFWHLISEGSIESERIPDLRRCERIRWPRIMIEAIGTDDVHVWRNVRGRNHRILIAVDDFSYVVVLEDREDYVMLWTAYPVEHAHSRRKLAKECQNWKEQPRNG